MDAAGGARAPAKHSVRFYDVQFCLTLLLLAAGAVWLNGFRARGVTRAAAARSGLVGARAEYARHTADAVRLRQHLAGARRDSAARGSPADSLSRGAAASLLGLAEADAAAEAKRIPPLAAGARAASTAARWFGVAMTAVLLLGVPAAWHWRRVQRRGAVAPRAVGAHGEKP